MVIQTEVPGIPPKRVAAMHADGVAPSSTDLERLIGNSDLLDLNFLWRGLIAAKCVARIVVRGATGGTQAHATGFMVSPRLMLTNHHVFGSAADAAYSIAEFDYERGVMGELPQPVAFRFRPDECFLSLEELDYALVAVAPMSQDGGTPLSSYGWLRLNPLPGKETVGEYVSIIQHPRAEPKQLVVRENRIVKVSAKCLHYVADTEPGSSGAAVFNDSWQVIALHHSSVPDQSGNFVANEGIRISSILAHMKELRRSDPLTLEFLGLCATEKPWSLDTLRHAVRNESQPQPGTAPLSAGLADVPAVRRANGGVIVTVPVEMFVGAAQFSGGPAAMAAPTTVAVTPAAPDGAEPAEEKLRFDSNYASRKGYAPDFLGISIPLPQFSAPVKSRLLKEQRYVRWLAYHHFSIAFNSARRLPHVVASNVDYGPKRRLDWGRKKFGSDQWIADPRLPAGLQTTGADRVYSDPNIDMGHVNRREDNCWGDDEDEVILANSDTFHYTNCTPQHKAFNRSSLKGVWGQLENHITKQSGKGRFCLFSGPVLADSDEPAGNVPRDYKVPRQFWKVVAVLADDGESVQAYGFLLDQSAAFEAPEEEFDPGAFKAYQLPLSQIEELTGLRFPDILQAGDAMEADGREASGRHELRDLADVRVVGQSHYA